LGADAALTVGGAAALTGGDEPAALTGGGDAAPLADDETGCAILAGGCAAPAGAALAADGAVPSP
jgi:hypothetical protein